MAYDENLAARIRRLFEDREDVREQKMFGGLAFMVRGHMCCGVCDDELMLRVGREQYEAALKRPHTREMDFTGQPMHGFVFVALAGTKGRALRAWVDRALGFVESLPDKKTKSKKKKSLRSRGWR